MSFVVDHGYLSVRDPLANGGPSLPGGTLASPEHNGWYSLLRPSTGDRGAAWRANTDASGTRVGYVLFGPKAALDAFAATEPLTWPIVELLALVNGGDATARAVARRWPVWRITGSVRDANGTLQPVTSTVVRLFYEGGTLPTFGTAFPWRFDVTGAIVGTDGAARVRVDSLVSPAMEATLSGYMLNSVAENEPVRT